MTRHVLGPVLLATLVACGDNAVPPSGREMVEELARAHCAWPQFRCEYPEPTKTEKIEGCTASIVKAMCSRKWNCSEGALYPARLLARAEECLFALTVTDACAPPWSFLPEECDGLFEW